MDNNIVNDKDLEIKENVLAGIVGAFLFSLAGAVIWFVLHLIGYIASISGLVGAVCAVKGYSVFSKKESKKGIVIAAIVSLLTMVIAWYFCLAYDVYDVYKAWFESGEIDFSLTFIESLRAAPIFLEEPEIGRAYFGDLALGLLFCLLGCGSYVFGKLRNLKKPKAENMPLEAIGAEEVVKEKTQESENNAPAEESHVDH